MDFDEDGQPVHPHHLFPGDICRLGSDVHQKRLWRICLGRDLTLPLVLPPTVAGFFLLLYIRGQAPGGAVLSGYFSVKIAFSWGATVIAAVTMSFPLMYRSAPGRL